MTNASTPTAAVGDTPLLSVVIPNFNHGAYLENCVEAHLAGDGCKREIILIDDCSTDDSLAIASAIVARHPNVRLIVREERGGPNAAVMTGLEEARGAYITMAAADDLVEPDFADGAIELLKRHPDAALCFHDPSSIYADTGRILSVPLALSPDPTYFSPDAFEAILKSNYFTISSNTVVYRRDPVLALGGFRPDLALYADWMTNLVLAFRHGACYRPGAKAHFRVASESYSHSGGRSAAWQRELLFKCLDALDQDYPDVRGRFRRAAVIPEMRLRDLGWLISDRRGRAMLTARLASRLAAREAWTRLRPLVPQGLRQAMRRLSAARTTGI